MTICSITLEAVRKRLEERKSLEEIGRELCDAVDDPRGKALRLVRKLEKDNAERYLIENADWLGYKASKGHDNTVEQKNLVISVVAPLSKVSIASVVSEVAVSDKVVKYTKKEIDTIPVADSHVDPIIPISSIPVMVIVPEATVSDKVPKIDTTPKMETQSKLDIFSKADILPKIDLIETIPIVGSIKKDDTELTFNISETNCRMGKSIPDCNVCELGIYDEKWHCDDYNLLCANQSCIIGKDIEDKRTCECGFKTNLKRIFWAHIKLVHKDNDELINMTIEEIKQFFIQQKMINITICPNCGYGSDTKKQVVLTKKELDNIRSFQSVPPEIREIVDNINLKLI